jgi:hypothetical protein
MRKLHRSAMLLLLCLLLTAPAFAETDEELAIRFYPQSLDEFFIHTHAPGTPIVRDTTLLRLDLDDSGVEDYLAVAYSNGLAAELLLIHGAGAAAVVVDQADEALGGRGKPVLEPIDIENDGVPELAVGFMRETWLYKFDGTSLVLFGPKRTGEAGQTTNLGTATYFDLDGDGTLEIFEQAPSSTEAEYIVHKLSGNGFALTSTEVMFYDRFEQVEGLTVCERAFDAPPGEYRMQVLTIAPPPAVGALAAFEPPAVISPQITINGAVVSGASGAPEGEVTLSPVGGIPVTLDSQNVLTVELPAAADTYIYVVITRTN